MRFFALKQNGILMEVKAEINFIGWFILNSLTPHAWCPLSSVFIYIYIMLSHQETTVEYKKGRMALRMDNSIMEHFMLWKI